MVLPLRGSVYMAEPILTDGDGRPLGAKPMREPGEDVGAYLHRLYAWRQAVTTVGNQAFQAEFRRVMRSR